MQNNEIQLKNKKITLMKWKAKVKKEFIDIMVNRKDVNLLQDILVYNNVLENVALNKEEFKYVLTQLRILSLGKDLDLEFYCDECKSKFIKTIDLNDIVKPIFENNDVIKNKNYTIKLGVIKNPQYYKEVMLDNPNHRELDFYLRIESVNGDDNFTLDSIIDLFDNMDISDYDDIFSQWEKIRFKIDDSYKVQCSTESCGHEVKYIFDEIPGFFPNSWFNVA